jgi:hypothetical protein
MSSDVERWADQGLKEVIAELAHCSFPLSLEVASKFIRAAYNQGYQDGLTEPLEELPSVLTAIERRDELALRVPVS